jgi:hypothetical protein
VRPKSYSELPTTITTFEDLYRLTIMVAERFRSPKWTARRNIKGFDHDDLADSVMTTWLRTGGKPIYQKPTASNHPPGLELPIEKTRAYGMIFQDIKSLLLNPTPAERGGFFGGVECGSVGGYPETTDSSDLADN